MIDDATLISMEACRFLLREPAPEVVSELIAEIKRLKLLVKNLQDDIYMMQDQMSEL